MGSMRPSQWRWQWVLLGVLVAIGALALLEPETAEAANTMIGLGAIGCVLWGIWQLMQET